MGHDMTLTNRAFSTVRVKAFDEDAREFTGIASTVNTDRMGDIVVPKGAQFDLPVPLLWQHDSMQPVGQVVRATVTDEGIEVVCRVAKPDDTTPMGLGARLDEAWSSVKMGIVRGLSIGFRAVKYSFMDSGGILFDEWDWTELSLVTVPANADAGITAIKSLAHQEMGAIARKSADAQKPKPVGASTVKLLPKKPAGGHKTMDIQKQLVEYGETITQKQDRMAEIMKASADRGETLDVAEQEEFDTIVAEVEELEKHIKRLKTMQAAAMKSAKPVDGGVGAQEASVVKTALASGGAVAKKPLLKDGLSMGQVVRFLGAAKGNAHGALMMAEGHATDPRVVAVLKAAVAAGTTTNAPWAGNLVSEAAGVYADFIEFLRPQTILGKFGQGGIPSLRVVPFDIPLIGQTSGGQGYWVGEGNAKPLTKFDFSKTKLSPLKVANIAVVTEELLRRSSVAADQLIRDQLVEALRARLDIDFIDPAKAAVTGISPASITNGVTGIPSSGNDAAAVLNDVRALFGVFIAANNAPTNGVWIMSATTALALSLMQNPLGQSEFDKLSMNGGTFLGMPVIVSEYVGDYVALVNASDIYLGDEGGFQVDMSREASLEMADNPAHNSGTPTGATAMVSMFQTNSVAFRAERYIDWAVRRQGASVALLTDVKWGQPEEVDPGDGG